MFWDFTPHSTIDYYRGLGQPVGPIFKSRALQEEYITLEYGAIMLYRNVWRNISFDPA
jgi:hypothetical protein